MDAIQSFKHTKGRWGNRRLRLSPWQIVWVSVLDISGLQGMDRLLRHGGNPVLRWNASVVDVYRDGNDSLRPVKPDREKVMALEGDVYRPLKRPRATSA
ncbi:hypothetical protein [Streptomyces sp. NPDC047141]|uniref:hypothetical protein n=1 Tax=unclassified Streptomyces TaxID=2593676 RepID=UPI0033E30192